PPSSTPAAPAPHSLSLHDALPISQRHGGDQDPGGEPQSESGDPRTLHRRRTESSTMKRSRISGFRLWFSERFQPYLVLELADRGDRKSTRLNSSHVSISYAVFCFE